MAISPTIAKPYFIAYDIFGYFIPGVVTLFCVAPLSKELSEQLDLIRDGGLWSTAALLVGAYILGHVIAALSSLFLEHILLKAWMGYPTPYMFDRNKSRWPRWVRLLKLRSYTRPYSKAFRSQFAVQFKNVFHIEPDDEHDVFWLSWSYNSLNHPAAFRRGTHFLNLYGFARNMAFSFLLVALSSCASSWSAPMSRRVWLGVFLTAAVAMFVAYTKFLRRLNDEVYRGFIASLASPIPSVTNIEGGI
jgi:hypothetical protein